MTAPKIIFVAGLVAVLFLLSTPKRHPLAYNAAAEMTARGVIQDVKTFWCPVSGEEGTHLTLATSRGEVQVHVAPSRFLNGRQWNFARGDTVEVVGTKLHYMGRDSLMARSINRGTETVALRTTSGKPLWVE